MANGEYSSADGAWEVRQVCKGESHLFDDRLTWLNEF